MGGLPRDTSDSLKSLRPIFDKEKIEAGFEVAHEVNRQAGQFLANRANDKQIAKKALSEAIAGR